MTTPGTSVRGAQVLADAGILAPVGTAGGKSQFGLGNVSGTQVVVGGLLPVDSAKPTAEQVVAAFAKASPAQVAQIQHMLILGGFYGSTNYTPNYGLVNKEDIDAFAKATTTAAQTGGDLSEYLMRQAKFGEYQGVAAAIAAQKPRTIQKADPLALSSMIEKEYEADTGRKPTPAERAGFIAAYNAAYTHLQNANYDSAQAAQGGTVDASGYSTAPVAPPAAGAGGFSPGIAHDTSIDALNQNADLANLSAEPTAPAAAGTATQQDFDPAAFAEDYVRNHATSETDAHAVTTQFSNFLNLLGGIK